MQSMWSAQQIQGSRDYQEDYFAVVENNSIYFKGERFVLEDNTFPAHFSLYLLADGMGGMGHGDVAAENALEEFINTFLNLCKRDMSVDVMFRRSLDASNQVIAEMVRKDPELRGMGCTFVAVLVDNKNESVNWISVGDSPLWLLRDGKLKRLNEIHTLSELKDPQRFLAANGLTAEHQLTMGHYLASALTGEKLEYIDNPAEFMPLEHADVLILASDGLETLPVYSICSITTPIVDEIKNADNSQQAFELTNRIRTALIGAINKSGHVEQDNTTLITAVQFENNFFTNVSP